MSRVKIDKKAAESIRMRGICSDVNPRAIRIIPGIFLGSIKTALSKPTLKNKGITHILCAAKDIEPYFPKVNGSKTADFSRISSICASRCRIW